MADFLTRLAGRTLGLVPTVQPMLAPMYAPRERFVGAEDAQQRIQDTWDVIKQDPAPAVATEYPQRGRRGRELALQDGSPDELSSGGLIGRTVHPEEMPSPLVPQGSQPTILSTQPPPQALHSSDRIPDIQPTSRQQISLERDEAASSLDQTPITESTRNVPVAGLHPTHPRDVTSLPIESRAVSTTVEQVQDSSLQLRYARGVLESEEVSDMSLETGHPQRIPLTVPQGKRPVGASLVPSVEDVRSTRGPGEPKAMRLQQGTHLGHLYNQVSRDKAASTTEEPSTPVPTIQVTIGRIEVRATPPSTPPSQPPRSGPPVMGLEEYLNQRAKGGY